MKRPKSHVILTGLACVVAYYAWNLSASGRTAIDWAVLTLVALAILWNLYNLGQRLYRAGGGKSLWHLARTLFFWIAGGYNTELNVHSEPRGWAFYIGCVLIVAALLDSIALWRLEQSEQAETAPAGRQ